MKRTITCLLSFIVGVAFTLLCAPIWERSKSQAASDDKCDQKIDLALGHSIIDEVPILDKSLQLTASNRVAEGSDILRNYTWWQLEEAWEINRKYDGALSSDFYPIMTNVYPRLKQKIKVETFTNFPASYLTEMSNFIQAADAMTMSQTKANSLDHK